MSRYQSRLAIVVLESPSELDETDSNRTSVLPFIKGIGKLTGDTAVHYANFYDKSSFRFDSMDKAILRRFHLKIEFGYLSADQLKEVIEACVIDKDKAHAMRPDQLAQSEYLTPGLVRGAIQGLRLRGFKPRTERLLEALQVEQTQQTDGVIGQPIGFVQ